MQLNGNSYLAKWDFDIVICKLHLAKCKSSIATSKLHLATGFHGINFKILMFARKIFPKTCLRDNRANAFARIAGMNKSNTRFI